MKQSRCSSAKPESAEADSGRDDPRLRRGTSLKAAAFAAAFT
jgi:hypothetical protein